jgi:hypothetical protein
MPETQKSHATSKLKLPTPNEKDPGSSICDEDGFYPQQKAISAGLYAEQIPIMYRLQATL